MDELLKSPWGSHIDDLIDDGEASCTHPELRGPRRVGGWRRSGCQSRPCAPAQFVESKTLCVYVGHEAALSHLELALDVVDVHQLRSNRRILEAEPLQLFVLSYRTLAEPCHMPGCEISQCKWNTQHEGGEKHGGTFLYYHVLSSPGSLFVSALPEFSPVIPSVLGG